MTLLEWGISLIIEAVFRLAFVMPQTLCLQGLMLGIRNTEGSYVLASSYQSHRNWKFVHYSSFCITYKSTVKYET
jgi:hypothetical protein